MTQMKCTNLIYGGLLDIYNANIMFLQLGRT